MTEAIVRTARCRLYLTEPQAALVAQFAGVTRLVYNLALEQRRDWWRQFKATMGQNISFNSQRREMTVLRRGVDWIGAVPRCVLENALVDLDGAYERFFSGKGGYPTPRVKGINDSFRIPGGDTHVRVCANARFAEIRIPKLGWCQFRLSRPLPVGEQKLLQATVSRDALGQAFANGLEAAAQFLEACDDYGDRHKATEIRALTQEQPNVGE